MDAIRKAAERMYKGLCSVIEYSKGKDEATKQTRFEEVETLHDQPCRLSFSGLQPTHSIGGVPEKKISAKLFISPDVTILPGSKVIVTQEGVTTTYKRSGEPAVYPSHQEIMLELFDGWA